MSFRISRFMAVRWTAITMAAVEIGIHAYLAPSHLEEKLYVGVLFVAADVLLAGVLVSLLTGVARPMGWLLGAGVCAGMFVGFVLSRTTGLPGYRETWSSDHWLGVASLPPEVVFVACAVYAVRFRRGPGVLSGGGVRGYASVRRGNSGGTTSHSDPGTLGQLGEHPQ